MEHAADRPASQAVAVTAIKNALEALEWDWGEAYLIGYDDKHEWWASRRDRIGGLLTAGTADELRQKIRADYTVKRVPRPVYADEPSEPGELQDRT